MWCQSSSICVGSWPRRTLASVPWTIRATASADWKVSPRPIRPASVWTRTPTSSGRSGSRIVSTAVIFMAAPLDGTPGRSGGSPEPLADAGHVLIDAARQEQEVGADADPLHPLVDPVQYVVRPAAHGDAD